MEERAHSVTGLAGLTWQDMSCEMARLFSDRVQAFMQQHVLSPTNPILGRVNHWMLRYESQVMTWPEMQGRGEQQVQTARVWVWAARHKGNTSHHGLLFTHLPTILIAHCLPARLLPACSSAAASTHTSCCGWTPPTASA